MKTVPCTVMILRPYRCYVDVPDDAGEDDVIDKAYEMIVDEQDDCLMPDLDVEITSRDIDSVYPEMEAAWTAGEEVAAELDEGGELLRLAHIWEEE